MVFVGKLYFSNSKPVLSGKGGVGKSTVHNTDSMDSLQQKKAGKLKSLRSVIDHTQWEGWRRGEALSDNFFLGIGLVFEF